MEENKRNYFQSFATRMIFALLILAAYVYAPLFPKQVSSEVTEQIYQEIIREDFYTNLQNYVMTLLDNIEKESSR